MGFKSLKNDSNFWIIIGTIAFLIICYIFYLNFYIAGKEEQITSTRFRVLDQIGDNVDSRLQSYISNSSEIEDKISHRISSDTTKIIPKNIIAQIQKEDINRHLKIALLDSSVVNQEMKAYSTGNYIIPLKVDTIRFRDSNQYYKVFMIAAYQKLMQGFLRNDVFDGLILIRDHQVIYNTLNQDMLLSSSDVMARVIKPALVSAGENDVDESSMDLSNNLNQGFIFSGLAFDIVISNKSFRAFLKPIGANGETWYILGLMERSSYNETSRSIAPIIVISLSLLLIFIILALPAIKLKVISRAEDLETGSIVNLALSVILGGSLLILFAFFLIQNLSRNHDVDNQLEDLSADIYKEFREEISDIIKQLNAYDSLYSDTAVFNYINPLNQYHTRIRKDIISSGEESKYFPKYYDFGDYYFWVDSTGSQSAYLTPFNEYGTMSNLRSRDYIQKKDEWYFSDNDTVKIRMESIVSVSSGKVKVALSMPSIIPSDQVVALSSKFHSIIDPIIPKDYQFCIIDKSGNVWFHSDIKRNLNENFIAECNENKNLIAAMYRNIPKVTSVDYYNNPYRIHISPVDHLPLYLITFYNKKAERSFQAQVISLTLLLLGALFLMYFIQTVVLLILNHRPKWSHNTKTIKNLTRPMKHLNGTYQFLFRVNMGISVLFVLFMIFLQDFNAIIAVFTYPVYLFTYHHWILNNNKEQEKVRNRFTIFNMFLLLLINVIGFSIKAEDFIGVLVFQAAILVAIGLFHLYKNFESKAKENHFGKNYIKSLVWLLLMFGILPSLKFYELANNKEIEIQTRHIQVDLMKQRELRNTTIGTYYTQITETDQVLEILKKRKDMGIYTDFLNHTSFNSSHKALDSIPGSNKMVGSYWDTLVSYFRPFYDEYNYENKFLILNSDTNSSMEWKWIEKDKLMLQYVSLTEDPKNSKLLRNTIQSQVPQLLFLKPYLPFHSIEHDVLKMVIYNSLFWIMVIGILYLFFLLIQFGINNIYSLNIIEYYSQMPFMDCIHRQMLAGSRLMLTKLSPLDNTDDFRSEFSEKYDCFTLDWADMQVLRDTPKKLEYELTEFKKRLEKHKKEQEDPNQKPEIRERKNKRKIIVKNSLVVFIDHFEYGYRDPDTFSEKLKIINEILGSESILLILLSQISEQSISEHYQPLKDQKEILFADFKELISRMEVIRQPVNISRSCKEENTYTMMYSDETGYSKLIERELKAADYMKHLESAMNDYLKNHCSKINNRHSYRDLFRRIDILAEKYYSGLLESCKPEEKHVLYDFADDLIVNPRNKDTIFGLLEKGLLIKDFDKLNFFNESFRRFLQKRMSGTQSNVKDVEIRKETGTWKGYRVMIIIIIVALFVFISMAKQDFFDNLNKLFILIAGGITAITGILGLLSRQNKPK